MLNGSSIAECRWLQRLPVLLGLVALFLGALVEAVHYREWDFDDSYIVYRIVENILDGHGWVYNVGEVHNASTSVLNTVLVLLFARLTGDIPVAAHLVGAVALLGVGIVSYVLARRHLGDALGLVAGYLVVHSLGSSYTWGLEVILFFFLLLLFVLLQHRERLAWAVVGVAALARPDGLLVGACKWVRDAVTRRRPPVLGPLIALAVLAPWIVFSLSTFGQVFPSTLGQKVWQGSSGLWGSGPVYLKAIAQHYVLTGGVVAPLLSCIALYGAVQVLRQRSPLSYLVIFAFLQQTFYAVLNVPGYHWYFAIPDAIRVLLVLHAAGAACARVLRWLREKRRFVPLLRHGTVAVRYGCPLVLVGISTLGLIQAFDRPERDVRDTLYQQIGNTLNTEFGPGRLGVTEVGTLGYMTRRTMVDIVGLTSDRGHFTSPERMDDFYADPPELLLLRTSTWRIEKAIRSDARFRTVYRHERDFEPGGFHGMSLFVRKSR